MAKRNFASVPISFLSAMALLALSGVTACVLPLPANHDVGRAVTVDPLTIKVGETTKEDVLKRVGEPDAIWIDERVFAYKWRHVSMAVLWFIAAPNYCCAGGGADVSTEELLLIQFDTGGLVQRVDRTRKPSDVEFGKFVKAWVSGGANYKS